MTDTFEVEDVIGKATVSEKISLLSGGAFWGTQALPRLNVPAVRVSDGPNGVRGNKFFNGVPAACLPCGTGLAATWDTDLLKQAGTLIGHECIAKGVHCWLGPTANIQRSPLGGRGFESFSEDPYISGKLAASYMSGVHSTGISTTMKHFVANDQEHERRAVNCVVSERALREIYLLPFQIALSETSPASIMTAYNKVNGIHASENPHLLRDILRNEWGQDIMVMSDWFGTYSVKEALEAGLDLEMPGPPRWRTMLAEVSVSSRKIPMKLIDERARSMLKFIKRVSKIQVAETEGVRNLPEDRTLNRNLAANSVVLLKNDRQVLPLPLKSLKKIALIGPNMKQAAVSGGGSASLDPYYTTTPFNGISDALGSEVEVQYEVGCYAHAFLPTLAPYITREDGKPGCLIKFYDQPWTVSNREVVDEVKATEANFQLMDYRHPRLSTLFWASLEATFTAPSTGTFEFGVTVSGTAKLFIDGKLVIDNTKDQRPGTSFLGNGSAEEKGEIDLVENHKYQILMEFASSVTSTIKRPGVVAFPGGGARIGFALKINEEESIRKAAQLARESDHVILCAGLSGDWESEGFDRPDMDLPGNTAKLITEVLKANPNTIVVTQSGTPITMTPWSSLATTHLHMWYGGNEGGNGLADVIFGIVNPAGRLPLSFPVRCQDNPAYLNSKSESGRILYGEDIYVGYRYYEKAEREVMFPFGHGLSYTSFEFSDAEISSDIVTVTVKNTGSVAGAEVVQLYVAPANNKDTSLKQLDIDIGRPQKELKGFAKVYLNPGESRKVTITLDKFAGAFWDETSECWVVSAGDYHVLIGKSSKDIVLDCKWNVKETRRWTGL